MEPGTSNVKASEIPATPQHEVQRKLGRSVLQFQQYEQLLKALLVHLEDSGTIDTVAKEREKRVETFKLQTLGGLVTSASRLLIRSSPLQELPDLKPIPDKIHFRMRIGIEFSPEERALIEMEWKKLIELRNGLVHHFIEKFDLSSMDGCRAACEYLDDCYAIAKAAFTRLQGWAENVQQLREETGAYIQSDSYKNFLKSQLRQATGATDDPT